MSFLDRFLTPKKNNNREDSPAERYLEYWTDYFKAEPLFYRNESPDQDIPGVSTLVFKDLPTKGFITGLTYGLSLVEHPDWKGNHAELCICVESESLDWVQVVGYIANKLRGKSPFSYGNTINLGQSISNDSDMDAFLVFAPGIFENQSDYLDINIGCEYKLNITALYPIYSDEIKMINEIGLEKFLHHPDFEMFSINRKKILT